MSHSITQGLFRGIKLISATVHVRSMAYSVEEHGSQYSLDYRAYFSKCSFVMFAFIYRFVEKGGEYVSPFHDIPLYANAEKTVCNMIMEVPRWSNAKMEVRYISL